MSNLKYLCGIVILVFVCVVVYAFTDTIPDQDKTISSMGETFVRIDLFMKEHKRVPNNLNKLPTRENYANSTIDAWGQQLKYKKNSQGVLSLTSYGKDKMPGGEGDNEDLIMKYTIKDAHGNFIISNPDWIIEAQIE